MFTGFPAAAAIQQQQIPVQATSVLSSSTSLTSTTASSVMTSTPVVSSSVSGILESELIWNNILFQ